MGRVLTPEMAGSIVRRVREDRGLSRAKVASMTGIGARTLYALEAGESENFGLGNYLRLLDVLGLSMSIDFDGAGREALVTELATEKAVVPWDGLGDVWKLGDGA